MIPELTLPEVERLVLTCKALHQTLTEHAVYLRPKRKMRSPHGEQVTTKESVITRRNYRDGKLHGPTSAKCYETGDLETIEYWNGMIHGKQKTFNFTNRLVYEADVMYGVLHGRMQIAGLKTWYKFGEFTSEGSDDAVHEGDQKALRAEMREGNHRPYDPGPMTFLITFS
jgi:antitoxin component YwqK of YwqJK toxin-antitoxin module